MSVPGSWIEDRITISTPEGVDLDLVVAGIGSRFVARLLDTLIQGGIIFALGMLLAAASAFSSGPIKALFIVVTFVVVFLYDPIFEQATGGHTPGKSAAGLRVVSDRGTPASLSASVIRNVVRIVDFLPALYGIGLVSMLASAHSQRLGDLAAGTLVVRERLGDRQTIAMHPYAAVTVPPDAVATWDVSAITPEELAVVRQFLARRLTLPPDARYHTAVQLAGRLAPKITGLPPSSHPEYVLEGVVVAKGMRA